MTDATPINAASSPVGTADHLPAVERWVLRLSAGLMLASLFLGSPRAQLGALCGALLSVLNSQLLSVLGQWGARGAAEGARLRLGMVLAAFQFKLGLIAALLFVTLRYLPVAPLWLLVGLSLLPLAICTRAIEYAMTGAKGDRNHHG